MSDDQGQLPSASSPPTIEHDVPAESSSPKQAFGVPLEVFVKGGTTSDRHDRHMAAMTADMKRRQAEADEEKRLAREHSIARGDMNDIASLTSHEFTDHPEVECAYVPLMYMSPNCKEVDHYGVGDIVMVQDPRIENELALMIFCPRCRTNGLPAWDCIITIRQANRSWHLDRRTAGELFIDPDGLPKHSAGQVVDGEKFHCPRCTWAAVIDKNRVITK